MSTEWGEIEIPDEEDTDAGSERSYDASNSTNRWADIYLSFTLSLKWLFITCWVNLTLYVLENYKLIYDPHVFEAWIMLAILGVNNFIVFVDIISIMVRRLTRYTRNKTVYKQLPPAIYVLDMLATCTIIMEFLPTFYITEYFIKLPFIIFRNYRILKYYQLISASDMMDKWIIFLSKHLFIFFFYSYTACCVWSSTCPGCTVEKHKLSFYDNHAIKLIYKENLKAVKDKHRDTAQFNPTEMLLVSAYFVFGSISFVGFGNPTETVWLEQLLSVVIMLSSYALIALYIADLTSMKIGKLFGQAEFSTRLQLMNKQLSHKKIRSTTRSLIIAHYITMWEKDSLLNTSTDSELITKTMNIEIALDRFWFAINQSYIFSEEPLYVKRLVSTAMWAVHYDKGTTILRQGVMRNKLYYVARGTIYILSEEDAESPLLALGMGSSFGALSLICPNKCRFSIVSKTYCILYILSQEDFWKLPGLSCLKLKGNMKAKFKERLDYARKQTKVRAKNYKSLAYMKSILKDEEELNIMDPRRSTTKHAFVNAYDAYILSRTNTRVNDGTFFQTTWPWRLNETSTFLTIWEYLVTAVCILLLFVWPSLVFYQRDFNGIHMAVWELFFGVIFTVDVLIQLITVVETINGTRCTFLEILKSKWNLHFICDVMAAIPFNYLVLAFAGNEMTQTGHVITRAIRFVKLIRIFEFLLTMERRYLYIKQTYFRTPGYIFFIIVFSYINACFYYMCFCYDGATKCLPFSWLNLVLTKAKSTYGEEEGVRTYNRNRFVLLLYYSFHITTQSNIANVNTTFELEYTTFCSMISLMFYCVLIADYASTHMLSRAAHKSFQNKVSSVVRYLTIHHVNDELVNRVKNFLRRQSAHSFLIRNRKLYSDLPEQMFLQQQREVYGDFLRDEPLFQLCPSAVLNIISKRCETIFVPVNEPIIYAGDHTNAMYIIECGHCEILSPITRKVKQVVSYKTSLCVMEMILGEHVRFDMRAVTDMLLIQIHYKDILFAFGSVPQVMAAFRRTVTKIMHNKMKIDNIFSSKKFQSNRYYPPPKEKESIILFDKNVDRAQFMDYKNNITVNNIFWIFQFILMPISIKPYSRFVKNWELFRTACVWIACTIYPAKFFFHMISPQIYYFMVIVDLLLLVDMYIQMHVCYYNNNGILVIHPNTIAQHYVKTRFLVDALGVFPLNYIVALLSYSHDDDKRILYESMASFNKVILVIRSRCLMAIEDPLEVENIWRIIAYTSAVLLLLYNLVTCAFMILTGDHVVRGNQPMLLPNNHSWVHDPYLHLAENIMDPIYFFIMTYKYVTLKSIMVGFDRVALLMDMKEKWLGILCTLSGYVFFAWITVYIASTFHVDSNATNYENDIRDLKHFFQREKVSHSLAKTSLMYYHYIWKKTAGISYKVIDMTSLSLRKEIDMALYGRTITLVTPFRDANLSFKTRICSRFVATRYVSGTILMRVNDIVDNMYIVQDGEVFLYYADGSKLAHLSRGGVYGNFDDVRMQRSMIRVVTIMDCEILAIKTSDLYKVLAKDMDILDKLQEQIMFNSLSYIQSTTRHRPTRIIYQGWSRFQLCFYDYLHSKWSFIMDLSITMLSHVCATSFIVFTHSIILQIIIYILDIFVVVFIILEFMYSIYARRRKTQIKKMKNKLRTLTLYTDIFSVLPIEMIPFVCGMRGTIFRLFYLNRLLRLYRLCIQFYQMDIRLKDHILLLKFGSILCFVLMTMHTGICLFAGTSCMDGNCSAYSWAIHTARNGYKKVCSNLYICSLFYTTTQMTARGHSGTTPKNKRDIILAIMFSLISKFLMALLMGYGLGMTTYFKYGVTKYNESALKLRTSLIHGNISYKLIQDAISYMHNMWIKTRGRQLPNLVSNAPMFLLEKIMLEAFGRHILENPIFAQCHLDFNRQVLRSLKMIHYFRHDIICHEGDINGMMYFIHSGKVQVLSIGKSDEIVIDILSADDCFGFIQGLIACTKHTHTYRAMTGEVIIMQLLYSDWNYLLTFFPASKFNIIQKLASPTDVVYRNSIRKRVSELALNFDEQ